MTVTRLFWGLTAIGSAMLGIVAISGYIVFGRIQGEEALSPADAIVVLGGEHDGREEYGLSLARSGYASNVVLSDPYAPSDPVMAQACAAGTAQIRVWCIPPEPSTTRGEAIFTQRLAARFGWHTVIVVSWGYHLHRAKYIFDRCYSGQTIMRAVPRAYDLPAAGWERVYLYQFAGFGKAVVQGTCAAN